MTPREDELAAENAYLKEQIEELTQVAAIPTLRSRLRLSTQQAKMLLVLTRRANFPVSKATVYRSVFEHDNGEGPEEKIMDIVLCNLRRVLKREGAPGSIKTIWGEGWLTTPELTAWVRSIIRPQDEQVAA